MTRYQDMKAVVQAVFAEMERPDLMDSSDAGGYEREEATTTSVDELLGILAELTERVTRLERAMAMLLAENRRASEFEPEPEVEAEAETVSLDVEPNADFDDPEPERYTFAPSRVQATPARADERPARASPPPAVPASAEVDTLSATEVDFDLPSHQWGAEGLTERARMAGPITPIQDSDYPEIRAPEEEKAAPKRVGPPEKVFVRAALESYPHIVESVCLMWGGREADAYINRLVIDTRGGRKGFPRDAMDDLLVLAEVCTIKSGLKPDFTPFDRDRSREREK
jgi:hypothetical protein